MFSINVSTVNSTSCGDRCASEESSLVPDDPTEDSTLNLVLLGKEGLAIALNKDIRVS